jgi:hypothetical protein
VASADVLESWGDGVWGTDFTWSEAEGRITIWHGNGLDYKFWVHDGSEVPGTGVINNITVHQDATGDFSILIEHPEGYAGALDWNEGDLTYGGGTSTVTGVKVDGLLSKPGRVAHPSRSEGWGRDSFGWKGEDSAMCGGGY